MRQPYELTPAAEADLREHNQYLLERSLIAADRFLVEFDEACRMLARFPGVGHSRTDLTRAQVRFYRVQSHLIVYRPRTRPLQIVRVLHGARDALSELEETR
ncbi:MAG: type II toxin-antitoxin system RelE/ParE family toxin [Phycisphaerales bacterium]|nr:type II toxin-antitoxin system RelE/ParE family toxin [Phycisphaerales bacterium]